MLHRETLCNSSKIKIIEKPNIMKTFLYAFLLLSICTWGTYAQSKSIQERLGYSKDTKLLIIHADDLGVSHSENAASIAAMENGSVNSASIMVPCPWFPEIAAYAKAHPEMDFGLHLTLTSEWKYYKWGPITPANEVPSLVNEHHHLYESLHDFREHASPEAVEKELRAQIETALKYGINVTHLDTHMGALYQRPEYFAVYKKLGREYKLPVLQGRDAASAPDTGNEIKVDNLYVASPEDYKKGMERFYTETLKSLPAGLNIILLHAAYSDAEMKAVTIDHPDYGADWRQQDFNFFTSEKCKKLLKDEKIQLITWKEIKNKLIDK